MTTLFVSPHFDDVAWSCGAHVRAARGRGDGKVLVATVFGKEQPLRQQEDARAMALLGCESVALPFLDAPERLGIAPTFASLLFTRYPREAADREALLQALRPLVAREDVAHLVLPLGVGGHVDHRIVHDLHDAWPSLAVSFYEDQPYAQVRGALASRMLEIGARLAAPLPRATLAEAEGSAREIFAGLIGGPADARDLALLAGSFAAPGAEGAPSAPVGPLAPHTVPADADLTARVLRCYATQLPLWFPTDEHLRRFTRARTHETLWSKRP